MPGNEWRMVKLVSVLMVLGSVLNSLAEDMPLLAELRKSLAGTTNVQSEFIQEKTLSVLQQKIVIKGRLAVAQPSRLSWQVLDPIRYTMVLDGAVLKQWDETTGKVQTMALAGNPVFKVVVNQLQGWFTGQFDLLTNDFTVAVNDSAASPKITFTPREASFMSKVIRRVELTFREDRRYLHGLIIEEKTGDLTTMIFTNTVLNATIPATVWEVRPNGK